MIAAPLRSRAALLSWFGMGLACLSAHAFAATPTPSNSLSVGNALARGQKLTSTACGYRFEFQSSDGNLVTYAASGAVGWSAATTNKGGQRLTLQSDGNLSLLNSSGKSVWSSGTAGKAASTLILEDDGRLQLRTHAGAAVWSVGNAKSCTDGGGGGGATGKNSFGVNVAAGQFFNPMSTGRLQPYYVSRSSFASSHVAVSPQLDDLAILLKDNNSSTSVNVSQLGAAEILGLVIKGSNGKYSLSDNGRRAVRILKLVDKDDDQLWDSRPDLHEIEGMTFSINGKNTYTVRIDGDDTRIWTKPHRDSLRNVFNHDYVGGKAVKYENGGYVFAMDIAYLFDVGFMTEYQGKPLLTPLWANYWNKVRATGDFKDGFGVNAGPVDGEGEVAGFSSREIKALAYMNALR